MLKNSPIWVLGLNGWNHRSHDPAACLVSDGIITVMAEEDKITRQRHAFEQLPHRSIAACLQSEGITPSEIDVVAFGWDYRKKYRLRGIPFGLTDEEIKDLLFPVRLFPRDQEPEFLIVSHHLAHAAVTYFTSPFDRAAILVVDGQGEDASTSIFMAEGNSISLIRAFPIAYSLGYFYEAITHFLGFHYLDAGKTMGLAAYGSPDISFPNISLNNNGYRVTLPAPLEYSECHLDEQEVLVDLWQELFAKDTEAAKLRCRLEGFSGRPLWEPDLTPGHKSLAASGQAKLEELLQHLATVAISETGCPRLCIGGGVAFNVAANARVCQVLGADSVHVFPVADDAGVSAGAALWAANKGQAERRVAFRTPYLGPRFSPEEVRRQLALLGLPADRPLDLATRTANLLATGKVVGWVQDRAEVGPRALGNRSILADATTPEARDRVNRIKGRELWRPLAPVLPFERRSEFMEDATILPHMLQRTMVRREHRSRIPAVVHVDGSARPQYVRTTENLKLYRLVSRFGEVTGIPVLINTSLNGRGEPICQTPEDAIRFFCTSPLDILVLQDYVVEKPRPAILGAPLTW